jgi:hypothetical protein
MIFVQFPRVNLSSIFCHKFVVCINLIREKRAIVSFMDVMSQLFGVQIKFNIDI